MCKTNNARLLQSHRVLTGSLHTIPALHEHFKKHRCECMVDVLGKYSPNMVRVFYASYAATMKNTMPPKAKVLDQPPLLSTLGRDILVDIYEATIFHFIYSPSHKQPINTAEFD
ncbi:hypothetical protein KY284_036114 [Solanum tuberosum]|nr:hypothetical protein KY284_036114 [Solanum tuberosum]